MITRYEMMRGKGWDASYYLAEDEHGEYVTYDDHMAALAEAKGAGLSAGSIRTIRHALDDALDNVTEEYRHTNAIYREKYEAEDRAPILDAIAELATLPIPPIAITATDDNKEAP